MFIYFTMILLITGYNLFTSTLHVAKINITFLSLINVYILNCIDFVIGLITTITKGEMKMDIEAMTLREKIGQLCMFGNNGTTLEAETINMLTNFHVGNILLTKNNASKPKQLHHLTQNAQAYAGKYPLFIAMEQAGGEQNSLTNGVTISPNQQTLSQINNRLYTRQIAQIVSEELTAMGVNMNLYPKANIAADDATSYGASNKYTTRHVVAAIQGCHKE